MNISDVIKRVMFPIFSKVQEDNMLIKRGYTKVIFAISFIVFPLMLGIVALNEEFVSVFLSSKWERVSFLIIFMAPAGVLQSLITTTGSLYLTKNKTSLMLRMQLLWGLIYIISLAFGIQWNIEGIAVTYLLANLIWFYPAMNTAIKQISLDFFSLFQEFKINFFLSITMMIFIIILSNFLITDSGIIKILILCLSGAAYYLIGSVLFQKERVWDLVTEIKDNK
jgi:PST family polysaccharide transporter